MINDFKGLYLITDEKLINQDKYFDIVDLACSLQPSILQFRIKDCDYSEILDKAKELRKITRKHNTIFVINDYPQLVEDVDADGLHIGITDMSFYECRSLLGNNKIIGVSCYGDIDRAKEFIEKKANYIAIGTPYKTKTKPKRKFTNLETMKEIVNLDPNFPIFAIGGIETSNVEEIMNTGVKGVAVINGVFGSDNIKSKILDFKSLLKKFV